MMRRVSAYGPQRRGPDPVRILAWLVLAVLAVVGLCCCGGFVLVAAVASGQ